MVRDFKLLVEDLNHVKLGRNPEMLDLKENVAQLWQTAKATKEEARMRLAELTEVFHNGEFAEMRQGFLKQTGRLEAAEAEGARMAEWARGTEAAVRDLRGKLQEGTVHTHSHDLIQSEVSRLLGSHLALGAAALPGGVPAKTPLGFPISHPFEVDQRVTALERDVHRLTQVDASWDSQLQRLEQRVHDRLDLAGIEGGHSPQRSGGETWKEAHLKTLKMIHLLEEKVRNTVPLGISSPGNGGAGVRGQGASEAELTSLRDQVEDLRRSVRSLGDVVASTPASTPTKSFMGGLAQSLNTVEKQDLSGGGGTLYGLEQTQAQMEALKARTEEVARDLASGLARLRGEISQEIQQMLAEIPVSPGMVTPIGAPPTPISIPISPSPEPAVASGEVQREQKALAEQAQRLASELAGLRQQLTEMKSELRTVEMTAKDHARSTSDAVTQLEALRVEHNDTKRQLNEQGNKLRLTDDKINSATEQLQRMGGAKQEQAAMAAVMETQQKSAAQQSGESVRLACDQLEGRLVRALQDKCQSLQSHIDMVEGKMLTEAMLSRHTKDLANVQEQTHGIENRIFTVESSLSQNGIADALHVQKNTADLVSVNTRLSDIEKAVTAAEQKVALAAGLQDGHNKMRADMETTHQREMDALEKKSLASVQEVKSLLDSRLREECRAAMGMLEHTIEDQFHKVRRELDGVKARVEQQFEVDATQTSNKPEP